MRLALVLSIVATLAVLALVGLVIFKGVGTNDKAAIDPGKPLAVAPRPHAASVALAETAADAVSPDCATALAVPEADSRLLAEQRTLHVESHLKQQGDPLRRALVADLAGYREEGVRSGRNGLPADLIWRYGAPTATDRRELSREQRKRIADALAAHGVEGVVALGNPALLKGRWDPITTLVGHLIEEHGAALYDALPDVGAELPIGLHELAKAIEAGAAPADFAALLAAATVDPADPSSTWWNGANLAKLAAIHNRPEILRQLVERGVDPTAEALWGAPLSVLDDVVSLRRSASGAGMDALADVARQLALAGAQPFLPSTLAALAEWVPDLPLALHPDAALLLPVLEEAARELAELDADWSRQVEDAASLEARCEERAAWGDAASDYPGTGFAAKRRQQQALAEREALAWEKLRRAGEGTGERAGSHLTPADLERASAAWLSAVADQRWEDALAVADELGGRTHSGLLLLGLDGAPLDVLMTMLQRNDGALPAAAAVLLAASRRDDAADIAIALERFGFDPHYVDRQGRNAFNTLAQFGYAHEGAWRFADYLISRSVSVKPSALGLDPLDVTLMRLRDAPLGGEHKIRLARFLIDHGAPVEASHVELAEQLSMRNGGVYERLLRAVPELAS